MNNERRIAIIAPCPINLEIENGWFDRIKVIDDLVSDQRRIYFRVCPDNDKPIEESIIEHNELAAEAFINFDRADHLEYVAAMVEKVAVLYVHTLHYAEFALPHLNTGKVIVDIHGVTPEEEIMMGNPELGPKYEAIEKEVLAKALCCVMVTRSMERHYAQKYPDIKSNNMILPIAQHHEASVEVQPTRSTIETPVEVIYAGGLQAWQSVPDMLRVALETKAFARFTFLSAEWERLEKEATEQAPSLAATFGYANKAELTDYYSKADFGFILREDHPVNRVACPTKLFDYMFNDVIPITKTPHMGDFEEYGYEHISVDDFTEGYFPDRNSRLWMCKKNKGVVHKMNNDFDKAAAILQDYLSQH